MAKLAKSYVAHVRTPKKTLIASGCSWTNENFWSDSNPDIDCSWPKWPELLAKKLDMECINLGRSGAGNEYIFSSLLDQIKQTNKDNIGLVIPAWTQVHRKDIKVRGIWKHIDCIRRRRGFYKSAYQLTKKNENKQKRLKNLFFTAISNKMPPSSIAGNTDKSLTYYYSLQEICKSKKIPLKQFQMLPFYRSSKKLPKGLLICTREVNILYNNPYFKKIDNNFIGWPTERRLGGFNFCDDILDIYANERTYCISDLDNHPNAKGHEKIAEFLYDRFSTMNKSKERSYKPYNSQGRGA